MRTLVTGITGFVGGHLAEHLLAQGDAVTGCSRSGAWPQHLKHLRHRARLVTCDLAKPTAAEALFVDTAFDAVIHLAGLANPRACLADPALAHRENVQATGELYEAIRRNGQRPQILFVSTSYVYGQPTPEFLPVHTSCPIHADHPYAATKWAAEQLTLRFAESCGLDIIRVRPFNHIGPRQPAGYVVSDWAQQISAIEAGVAPPLLRVGNLDTRRDYTDVRDVVRAYRQLTREPHAGGVYNLGSGRTGSGREILHTLQVLSRVPWQVEIDPARTRVDEAREIVANANPLFDLIGWKPEIDLDTTLRDTLNFWRNQQGGKP